MSVSTLVTADEFAQMSFDGPVELVRGEIVEMTRPGGVHGFACVRSTVVLDGWASRTPNYVVLANDTGVITNRDPDTVRGPDVFVVRRARLPEGRIPQGNFPIAPEVCIEVRSPHDRWSEIIQKVSEYLVIGVQEVWVIDPERRRVHVYFADTEPDVLEVGSTLRSRTLPEFECSVDEFFRGL